MENSQNLKIRIEIQIGKTIKQLIPWAKCSSGSVESKSEFHQMKYSSFNRGFVIDTVWKRNPIVKLFFIVKIRVPLWITSLKLRFKVGFAQRQMAMV